MATQVTKWQSKFGVLFDTEVEADYADRRQALIEFVERFYDEHDDVFDAAAAAEALLDTYSMTELPK